MSKNIGSFEVDEENHKVIITYDPDSKERSSSGKNNIIATSGGFQYKGKIGVSFNIIRKD